MLNSFHVYFLIETQIVSGTDVASLCTLHSSSCKNGAKCCLDSLWSFVRRFMIMFSSAV